MTLSVDMILHRERSREVRLGQFTATTCRDASSFQTPERFSVAKLGDRDPAKIENDASVF